MRKDIEKLIAEITILAIQISNKSDIKILADFSGYSNSFRVSVIYDNNLDTMEAICIMYMNSMKNASIKQCLKHTKRQLEVLKNE
jgi:hypothetical protein